VLSPLHGRAWLFFGHQHKATDFFYREELEHFLDIGVLTRLSTAWSRDSASKIYVQDRMRQEATELWAWLQEGAYFYVCGDAVRMAKEVETAMAEIAAKEGCMSGDAAKAFAFQLKASGRYQADVY
jgi:sulfite reductase (NADPH) flavoprotein alpha-component